MADPDLKFGDLVLTGEVQGERPDKSLGAILTTDRETGATIIRALGTDALPGSVAFQDKNGDPLALSVSVDFSDVLNTPTTLAGYGITDAAALVHGHDWADVDKTGSSLADLATRSAGDLTSGVLLDARVAESNVTQHQAALEIAASQITSGALAVARGGTGLSTLAAGALLYASALDTLDALAPGTDGQVLTLTGGAPGWAAPTGGLADAFTTVADADGEEQFAASGADALQFAAGADIGLAFDATNKRVTIAFTGSLSGITRGFADVTADSGSVAAQGADTLAIEGAGGITTAAANGALTITLGNHSAALLTSGTLPDARIAETGVTQHQDALSIAVSQLTGTLGAGAGGTGLDASAADDGAILIGTGAGLELGALEAGSGITVTRTATGLEVSASGGAARAARAYLTVDQSIPGSTWTTLGLPGESHDTDALHDTAVNPSRIKLDRVGLWRLHGQVSWAQAPTYDGYRGARLLLTGATVLTTKEVYGTASAAPVYAVAVSRTVRVTDALQYAELQGHHFNGAGLTAKAGAAYTFLEAEYLGAAE